jgi:hypothetical protein
MHAREGRLVCPRCGVYAEQTWHTGRGVLLPVRWSLCHSCGRISVWRGPILVYPSGRGSIATSTLRRAAQGVGGAARLEALWEAVRQHVSELRILSEATARLPRRRGDGHEPPDEPGRGE